MKALWICLLPLALGLAACGGDKNRPQVGGNNNGDNNGTNNGESNDVLDTGMPNNSAPDADRNNATPDANVPDESPDDTGGPDDMGSPVDMAATPDMAVDMPPDMADLCPARNGAAGVACGCDAQCASSACAGDSPGVAGFCTITCTTRQDCGAVNGACTPEAGGATSYCWPDDTGDPCTAADASSCSQGLCIEAGSNHNPRHFCSVGCTRASDCATGHACSPVRCKQNGDDWSCIPTIRAFRDGANKEQTLLEYPEERDVCVRVGLANACSLPTDQLACASAVCDDQSTSGARCTAQCLDSLDCPAGGCVDVNVSDPALPIRVCDLP